MKGPPLPITALAASMPLNPLRNDSARPAERVGWMTLYPFTVAVVDALQAHSPKPLAAGSGAMHQSSEYTPCAMAR